MAKKHPSETALKKERQKSSCGEFLKPGDPDYPDIPANLRAVRVCDDSMDPVFPKGCRVLFCPDGAAEVKDGDLVVAFVGDGCLLVRRCFLYGEIITLTSMNVFVKPRIVNKADCRIWPVLGVWFDGMGTPPEGF